MTKKNDNLTHLSDVGGSLYKSPKQLLKEAMNEIAQGRQTPNKGMVILLEASDEGDYNLSCEVAGMNELEAINLLTIVKSYWLREWNER